ncbi:BRCA1-associated protein 2-domain-containing protein [Paraphysoderma sedebokerense]|nr:BRCA1-associated protein 2-domain-containing protein [Paraphysoderma sedebokerense]
MYFYHLSFELFSNISNPSPELPEDIFKDLKSSYSYYKPASSPLRRSSLSSNSSKSKQKNHLVLLSTKRDKISKSISAPPTPVDSSSPSPNESASTSPTLSPTHNRVFERIHPKKSFTEYLESQNRFCTIKIESYNMVPSSSSTSRKKNANLGRTYAQVISNLQEPSVRTVTEEFPQLPGKVQAEAKVISEQANTELLSDDAEDVDQLDVDEPGWNLVGSSKVSRKITNIGNGSNLQLRSHTELRQDINESLSPNDRSQTKSLEPRHNPGNTAGPTIGLFVPVHTGTTTIESGILHLYRDTSEIPTSPVNAHNNEKKTSTGTKLNDNSKSKLGGTTLCVLAVPSYMTPRDFLSFVGQYQDSVSHFRIIRDHMPNRYMVLMRFHDEKSAEKFRRSYNGKPFNSMEPELCHVVYIDNIEFKSTKIPQYAFPNDIVPSSKQDTSNVKASSPSASNFNSNSLHELPTCPVCLDRLDSNASGLLTILCQHTFHCQCLTKWGDHGGTCPVCRHSTFVSETGRNDDTVGAEHSFIELGPDSGAENECEICGSTEALWICLVCGNIGCGRYQEAHAYQHYLETSHLYALELQTQRVWDYAGDGYVHRLIQNKADGKLVELPGPRSHNSNDADNRIPQDKLDSITLEFSYLLTTQLETQRQYYENQLTTVTSQLSSLSHQMERYNSQASSTERETDILKSRMAQLESECKSLMAEKEEWKTKESKTTKEKRVLEKKIEKLETQLRSLQKELEDEKEINSLLTTNSTSLKQQLTAKDTQIQELSEQVRDLMFFLETQQKIEASPLREEIKGGTVVVENKSGSGSSPKKRRGRK